MFNMLTEAKLVNLMTSSGSTAGTTSVVCQNFIDLAGFDSVSLIATLGECTAAGKTVLVPGFGDSSGTVAASSGTSSRCAGWDAASTEVDVGCLLVVDLHAPFPGRWAGASIVKATQVSTVEGVLAIAYNKHGYHGVATEVVGSSGSGRFTVADGVVVQGCT